MSSSHSNWMQHPIKRRKDIHLPIMRYSSKAHIPLVGAASKLAAIEASLVQARLDKIGKATLRATSPHHWSCQKLILVPSLTSNLVKLEKLPHPFLIFFHNPTFYWFIFVLKGMWAFLSIKRKQNFLKGKGMLILTSLEGIPHFQQKTLGRKCTFLWVSRFPPLKCNQTR